MKNNITQISIWIIAFLVASCATVVKPTGGPRDMSPPEILNVSPKNGITGMQSKKIEIEFDEYVILDKLNEQLVVSPPMPEKPKVKIKGKKVVIDLPDSLNPNTTYSIFFGNAIVNYKEKIPAENVEYVFSTGNHLDSLFIEGHVINAEDASPAEETFVMLYPKNADSAIYKEKPYYLAKVRPGGYFRLSSLADGEYQLYALQDLNSNYHFDQVDEKLAFLDSLVVPYTFELHMDDSSGVAHKHLPEPLRLNLFCPIPKKQDVVSHKAIWQNQAEFIFRKPVKNVEIRPLNHKVKEGWALYQYGKQRDTLHTWFRSLPKDTFAVEIKENGKVLDTLTLKYNPREVKTLEYKSNTRNGMDFFKPISLSFKNPVQKIDASRIFVIHHKEGSDDTLKTKLKCLNPEFKTRFEVEYDTKETQSYSLFIPDSVIYDIYGHSHDTIAKKFSTAAARSYGSLKIQIDYHGKHPMFIELLRDGKKVATFTAKHNMEVEYPYLPPGQYTMKAVEDRNDNGRWDTGDQDKRRQPEKVIHLGKSIHVKANWDITHKWLL